MAYERYIVINGKTYGPYIYSSSRKDGKVVSDYVGKSSSVKSKKSPAGISFSKKNVFFGLVGLFFIISLLFFLNLDLTGNVSLDIKSKYQIGEMVEGKLNFNLMRGELIPADSKVVIGLGEEVSEFYLSELVDIDTVSGNFYAEGTSLSGEGLGYGVVGVKKIYPDVNFELRILNDGEAVGEIVEGGSSFEDEESSVEVVEGTGEEVSVGDDGESESEVETVEETGEENVVEEDERAIEESESEESSVVGEESEVLTGDSSIKEKKEKKEKKDEGKTEDGGGDSGDSSSEESSSGDFSGESTEGSNSGDSGSEVSSDSGDSASITGGVISETGGVISGIVSKGNKFTYNYEKGKTAELVSGRVTVNGEQISDDEIKVNAKNKEVVVSTNYFIEEEGFGEEYLGKNDLKLKINLEQFNLTVDGNSVLIVRLVYGNEILVEASKDLAVEENVSEEEVVEVVETNVTIEVINNETGILVNETIIVNATGENLTIDTVQYGAVLNRPVKWKKTIVKSTNVSEALRIEIPKESTNITVYKINDDVGGEVESEEGVVEEINEIVEEVVNETVEVAEENESSEEESENEMETVEENVNETIDDINEEVPPKNVLRETSSEVSTKDIRIPITAYVVSIESDESFSFKNFFKKLFGTLTGRAIDVVENEEIKEVVIDDIATEFEIEYETPAPVANETETGYGKQVVISSDVHYENILAYTELPYLVLESQIKLYNIINGTRVLVDFVGYEVVDVQSNQTNVAKIIQNESGIIVENVTETRNSLSITGQVVSEEIINETIVGEVLNENVGGGNETLSEINGTTLNETVEINVTTNITSDRMISYIEWVVPHLSNQTYELEITILNVQSYPTVGGNWTVAFNTSGEANLTVSAYDGTTYGFEGQNVTSEICEFNITLNESVCEEVEGSVDLEVLETRCGNETLNTTIRIDGVDIPYEIYQKKKRIEEIRRELG